MYYGRPIRLCRSCRRSAFVACPHHAFASRNGYPLRHDHAHRFQAGKCHRVRQGLTQNECLTENQNFIRSRRKKIDRRQTWANCRNFAKFVAQCPLWVESGRSIWRSISQYVRPILTPSVLKASQIAAQGPSSAEVVGVDCGVGAGRIRRENLLYVKANTPVHD